MLTKVQGNGKFRYLSEKEQLEFDDFDCEVCYSDVTRMAGKKKSGARG